MFIRSEFYEQASGYMVKLLVFDETSKTACHYKRYKIKFWNS